MDINIEIAQEYVMQTLIEARIAGDLHTSCISNHDYDVYLDSAIEAYKQYNKLNTDLMFENDYSKRNEIYEFDNKCKQSFSDALWNLCQKGILRPGTSFAKDSSKKPELLNEGFAVTNYGLDWITKFKMDDLIPADPNRLSEIFAKYQKLFGENYYKRVKEAVNCYQSGNYLACCVMCGAATEAMLLSAAFIGHDENDILRIYKTGRGRSKLENMLFGKAKSYIKENYTKYTDLLKYWRDETAHGHDSAVDNNEAFIALLTLLRFTKFINEHWNEITIKQE